MLIASSDARYKTLEDTIVEEFDFSQGTEHWSQSSAGVSWVDREPPEFVLNGNGLDNMAYVARVIPPPEEHRFIAVSVELQTDSLLPGKRPQHGGRVLLMSFDDQQRYLWYWPANVAQLAGTNDWDRYSAVIPVHPDSGALQLVAYAVAESGQFRLRNLRIGGAEEVGLFTYLRYALVGGWVLTGLGLLYVLFSRPLRNPLRLVTLAVATVSIIAGLVPQPYLKDSLKTLLIGTQDIVFAGKDVVEQLANGAKSGDGRERRVAQTASEADIGNIHQDMERQSANSSMANPPSEGDIDPGLSRSRYWTPSWQNLDKKAHLISFTLLGLLAGLAYRRPSSHSRITCMTTGSSSSSG